MMKCTHNNFAFKCGVQTCMCACDRVGGDCAGAWCPAMCAPMWASWLPAWLQMAQCLSTLLSRHIDTNHWPHGHSKWTYEDMQTLICMTWSRISSKTSLLYRAKCCKIMNNSATFVYSELFSRSVSHWVRQHTLAGVAAAGVLAHCEGRTTGTSTWLGANTWGPVMVNKISV